MASPKRESEAVILCNSAGESKDMTDRLKELESVNEELNVRVLDLEQKIEEQTRSARRAQRAFTSEINELKRKLWGGFSDLACQRLQVIASSETSYPEARAVASWELCRFHMANKNLTEARKAIDLVRKHSKSFIRQLRPRLVEIQLLIATGEFEMAQHRINDSLKFEEYRNNTLLGLCNLINAKNEISKNEKIINTINEVLKSNKLAEITLSDNTSINPFNRLSCDQGSINKIYHEKKVSILVPAFNAEQYIEVAVNSLLNQSWQNLEIIIVDDASSDKTWEKIQAFAKRDSRIVPLRNDKNMGAYPTRNRALQNATGDIITVHDSDDWSHPQLIELQIAPLLNDEKVRGSFSMMCRANADLFFNLRPSRDFLEFIHRSYPSLMMRREDVLALAQWDGVIANADDEFVKRARLKYGEDAFVDVAPRVPLSIFLSHEASLTESAGTNLRSITFGLRQEYHLQAAHWYKTTLQKTGGKPVEVARTSKKHPFPCPELLLPKHLRTNKRYDITIISDLSLLGGTRSCNLGYISVAKSMGLNVALFHWPRGDLKLLPDIAPEYREHNESEHCDIITCEESIQSSLVIVHHPPIIKYKLDRLPEISTKGVYVLVNQLPRQVWHQTDLYYLTNQVNFDIEDHFGRKPKWIAISPLTERLLRNENPKIDLISDTWYPPFAGEVRREEAYERYERKRASGDQPILGRHSRDHWTKWPTKRDGLAQAYCAGSTFTFRVLGGASSAIANLGGTPRNWEVLPFDSVKVDDFLGGIDIFLNFNNPQYIEEFGRNIMEAMARGIPVIADPVFQEVFGEAVIAARPNEVESLAAQIWNEPERYREYMERGFSFVEQMCSHKVVKERLSRQLNSLKRVQFSPVAQRSQAPVMLAPPAPKQSGETVQPASANVTPLYAPLQAYQDALAPADIVHAADLGTDSFMASVMLSHTRIELANGLSSVVWNLLKVDPDDYTWQAKRLSHSGGTIVFQPAPGAKLMFIYGLAALDWLVSASIVSAPAQHIVVLVRSQGEVESAQATLAQLGWSGSVLTINYLLFGNRGDEGVRWNGALFAGLFDGPSSYHVQKIEVLGVSTFGRSVTEDDVQFAKRLSARTGRPVTMLIEERDQNKVRSAGLDICLARRSYNFWNHFFDKASMLVDAKTRPSAATLFDTLGQALLRSRLIALASNEETFTPGAFKFQTEEDLLSFVADISTNASTFRTLQSRAKMEMEQYLGSDFHIDRLKDLMAAPVLQSA